MKQTLIYALSAAASFAPLVALAQADATTSAAALIHAPANVGLGASELASFVLSAAALVVAGIALARTRRHHRVHHTSTE